MSNYRRLYVPGSVYFFTLVTYRRMPILTTPVGISCLRAAWRVTRKRLPFETIAICVLPDHLHCLWVLPEEDADFSERWRELKSTFTRTYRRAGGREGRRNASRRRSGEAAVWHRRFWEHRIRDEEDMRKHFDYTHFRVGRLAGEVAVVKLPSIRETRLV